MRWINTKQVLQVLRLSLDALLSTARAKFITDFLGNKKVPALQALLFRGEDAADLLFTVSSMVLVVAPNLNADIMDEIAVTAVAD